jgi:hypothetical protein
LISTDLVNWSIKNITVFVITLIKRSQYVNRDRDLPLLAMALHSTVNKNIGFTANKLMLGRGLPNTSAQRREHDPWILEKPWWYTFQLVHLKMAYKVLCVF